jgi:hypothetical protein
MNRILTLACVVVGLIANASRAQFHVTAFSGASGSGETAQGTSNGIGWMMSPTFLGIVPVTNDSFTGFSDPAYFSPAVPASDVIQIGAESYTLTFDQPIASAYFYLRADNKSASGIDFGITPTLVSGEVAISGTAADPSTNGGIVRLDNVNSTTLTHTPFIFNGVQVAWFVTPVPEPSTVSLTVVVLLTLLSRFRLELGRR